MEERGCIDRLLSIIAGPIIVWVYFFSGLAKIIKKID